ncbi:MAG: hypothetical protein AAF962_18720 [Actinomycetota bacterium]
MARLRQPVGKSSTGLDENVAAVLAVSVVVSGLVFLLIERKSAFVRFHAIQSLVFFGVVILLGLVVGAVPFLPGFISTVASMIALAVWVVLLVQTYRGSWLELPVIGPFARRRAMVADE